MNFWNIKRIVIIGVKEEIITIIIIIIIMWGLITDIWNHNVNRPKILENMHEKNNNKDNNLVLKVIDNINIR